MPHDTEWTLDRIKIGLDQFFVIHGRYPNALEIDKYELLPSSRQIQRKFGGLVKLRGFLGLPLDELNLAKGVKRSSSAKNIGRRGKDFEKKIYLLLVSKFGEVFVHAQKPFNDYSGRLDFFVYCRDYKFGIDVFYATDMHSLIGCINLKSKTYQDTSFDVILLSGNENLDSKVIEGTLSVKKNKLLDNIKVLDMKTFYYFINELKPLQISQPLL